MSRQYFDVVVVNPAAESYRVEVSNSAIEGLHDESGTVLQVSSVALQQREAAKRALYRAGPLGRLADDPSCFVPFVVEATGRLGPAANETINSLLRNSKRSWVRSAFVAQLGAIIIRCNALMALRWVG